MNITNDCECNNEENPSTTCTSPCADSNRLREARLQKLKSKLTKVQDKPRENTDVDSEDSITSFETDDLEYLMRLEELMTLEYQTKHQLKELKRWEQTHIKILQSTEKIRPKKNNKEHDGLRGQLDVKSAENQQLAERIHELEDQVESLKGKLLHCNEQVAKLTGEQRDGASKLAESVDVDDDTGRQIKEISGALPNVKDKVGIAKSIILGSLLKANLDQTDTQDVASSAVVPTTSKNIQAKAKSTDRAIQNPPVSVIRKWSNDSSLMIKDIDTMLPFEQNQSSTTEAPDAQQMESFMEDSATVYQSHEEKVSKLDETHENNSSFGDNVFEDNQKDKQHFDLFRKGDIYDEMSFKEFRQVSVIVDSNIEESEDEKMQKKKEIKSSSRDQITADVGDFVRINRQELEMWLKNVLDVLYTIRICQTCSMMKGQLKEVCKAICYKLGIELPNDDGKDEKANAIEMRKPIKYQTQDGEAAVDIIEKEIPTIGNHSEILLTDQTNSAHLIKARILIKKASEYAKLRLLEKPIDSAIGTSVPSTSEALGTYSKTKTTTETFINSLPEISLLNSPVGTSTPIRKNVEQIRSESLEKSLHLSFQPLDVIKNQQTLSESVTRFSESDKTLVSTQTNYKSIDTTNFQTKMETNKSVEFPRVSNDSQIKISNNPSHHIDLTYSDVGHTSTITPDVKGIIKGEGEAKEYENLSSMPSGISRNIQNSNTKSTAKIEFLESTQALSNKNSEKNVEQKIDVNKEEIKRIKKDRDKKIRQKDDDGKDESGSFSEIIRGKEKTQFFKKKYSTHDKEPITPQQSTSNSREINKSSFIIPKTDYCVCRDIKPVLRSEYEQICAKKRYNCLNDSSRLRNNRIDYYQRVKQKSEPEEPLTGSIASTETHNYYQTRNTSIQQRDFSCKVCDCNPCGSGNKYDIINVKNQVSNLKNFSPVPDKKNQAVLAKLHKSKR